MKRRKLLYSILAMVLALMTLLPMITTILGVLMAGAASQAEIDALKTQQAGIAEIKSELKGQIAELEEREAAVLQIKAALDYQNELTRQEILLINEQIDLYKKLIEIKELELEDAIAAEKLQYERYRKRLRAMEEGGTDSYIAILFQATSFSDLLSRIDDIAEIMEYDVRLEEELRAARQYVEKVKAEYEAMLLEFEATEAELQEKKAQLEAEIEAAYLVILALEEDIEKFKAELEANEAEEARIQAEIYAMVAELQRLEAEAKKRAEEAKQVYQGGAAEVGASGSYTWPLPSTTVVTSPFGTRTHPIFGDSRFHYGIDIGGTHGAAIVAADGGVVLSATTNASYGNYVIINHGGGNTTLYAHMSSMAVSSGSSVNKGDTIGYVGSTGWSTGPHLHFEVRVNNAAVDPLQYFSNYTKAW